MGEIQTDFDNYHRLIGEVITKNVALEGWLETLLWRALEGSVKESRKLAVSILSSQNWTSGKIKLCNLVVIHLLDKDFLTRWNSIYTELRALNTFRGDIAHSELVVIHDADDLTVKTALKKGSSDILRNDWEIKIDQLETEIVRYKELFSLIFHFCKDLGSHNADKAAV